MAIEARSKVAGFRSMSTFLFLEEIRKFITFSREGPKNPLEETMKTTHLLATLIAATLPLTVVLAEDTAKTETTDQKQEQSSDTTGMKGMMGKGQMMSKLEGSGCRTR